MASQAPSATSTKRSTTTTSSTLPAERPPCTIHPTAIIADKALLTGSHPVSIAEHTVIHPYAHIRAESGPVTIGPYCVIAEGAIIGLPANHPSQSEVVLERHVSVESGAEVCARRVGEGSEVGVHARIGAGAEVGRFCRLTATEVVGDRERLEDFTVVFGDGKRRRDGSLRASSDVLGQRVRAQEKHVDVLRKLIPDGKAKFVG